MRISDWSSDVCSSDLNNGRQCSAPRNIGTMPFDHLSPVLADALIARGYEALTPVQAQVVEAEAKGRDLLVSAQTGSGKTVAFGHAMADELLERSEEYTTELQSLMRTSSAVLCLTTKTN